MPVDFRYRRLGYLVFNVTDIERSTQFATEVFGLDQVQQLPDGSRTFRAGPWHQDVILTPATSPAFVRGSWELETDDDLDRAYAHYQRLGLKPAWIAAEEAAMLALDRAFRVVDPVIKSTHEYYSKMTYLSSPRKNTLTSFEGGKHFGLTVPDTPALTRYMTEHMGFLVSDYLEGGRAALLRAFPNPNHHSFAPLQLPGGRQGFHHCAFMVNSIDDIGKFFNRLKKFKVPIQFGIGRHPTSGSIHLYAYDPDFFVWEYTLGMEQFAELNPRQPRRMSGQPENFDLWGAVPDQEYAGRNPPYLQQES